MMFVESALHQSTDGYFSFIGVRWATSDLKGFKEHFRLKSLMKGDQMILSSLIHKNSHDLIEALNGHKQKAQKDFKIEDGQISFLKKYFRAGPYKASE